MGATNVDPKALQLILQGSVRLQVNEGPLEIASTFLSANKVSKYPPEKVEKLREKFRDFLKACNDALTMNRRYCFCLFLFIFCLLICVLLSPPFRALSSLVKHDQKAYQEDLEEGFEDVKTKLWPYVSEGATDLFKS